MWYGYIIFVIVNVGARVHVVAFLVDEVVRFIREGASAIKTLSLRTFNTGYVAVDLYTFTEEAVNASEKVKRY